MVYQWKQKRFPVAAQTAGEELERIKVKNGGLVPIEIVDESRPDEAVLHNCFEWNDETAAEAYREVQAREILRYITVVVESKDGEETTRAFVPVVLMENEEDDKHKEYVSVTDAMSSDDYRAQILEQAKRELISFKVKYKQLNELSNVFKAIDEL